MLVAQKKDHAAWDSGVRKTFEFGVVWVCFSTTSAHKDTGGLSFALLRVGLDTLWGTGPLTLSYISSCCFSWDMSSVSWGWSQTLLLKCWDHLNLFKHFGLMKSFIYLKPSICKCKCGKNNTMNKLIYFERKVKIGLHIEIELLMICDFRSAKVSYLFVCLFLIYYIWPKIPLSPLPPVSLPNILSSPGRSPFPSEKSRPPGNISQIQCNKLQ